MGVGGCEDVGVVVRMCVGMGGCEDVGGCGWVWV